MDTLQLRDWLQREVGHLPRLQLRLRQDGGVEAQVRGWRFIVAPTGVSGRYRGTVFTPEGRCGLLVNSHNPLKVLHDVASGVKQLALHYAPTKGKRDLSSVPHPVNWQGNQEKEPEYANS